MSASSSAREATAKLQATSRASVACYSIPASGATEASRALLAVAFEQTALTIDSSGITKVTKARAKRSRDDAAAALLLAAGELARRPAPRLRCAAR